MTDERDSLMAKAELSRRGFVAGVTLAAGYALAVSPATAAAITTDAEGAETGAVGIPSDGAILPAYFAKPKGGGALPTVLVVQEIFGVHEYIRDTCRRLAKLGYLAVAPELYFRQGDPSVIADIPTLMSTIVAKVPDAQVIGDLDACARWAAAHGGDASRLGITGFCWGGRITWLYAAHNPRLKAAVAWYGRLTGDTTALQPRHPVDIAADLKAPVLGLYGGADQGIPSETVDKMKDAAKRAKVTVEFVVYPDAPHAFHADYRPSYREGPAKDGWSRLHAWFKSYL